jgi:hypothetical protein
MREAAVATIAVLTVGLYGCGSRAAEVSFTLRSPSVTLNAPIRLDLEIRNGSQTLVLDLGPDYKSAITFEVETPDGKSIHADPPSIPELSLIGRVIVEPHAEYRRTYVLNEWYSFRTEGTYTIRPKVDAQFFTKSGTILPIDWPPDKLRLTVGSRDPKTLSQICDSLLEELEETSDAEKIADTSLRMSYIEDPVAVPCVKEGLQKGKLMWQYAIPGLARIADLAATDLLIDIMKRGDVESGAASAKSQLQALLQKAKPELREKIAKSLEP